MIYIIAAKTNKVKLKKTCKSDHEITANSDDEAKLIAKEIDLALLTASKMTEEERLSYIF